MEELGREVEELHREVEELGHEMEEFNIASRKIALSKNFFKIPVDFIPEALYYSKCA
ncbi:hypothetical protein [Bhargavaea cecembensis]|uniref:hypothetical protein n=1 Tax=Bhargavaea cecembensis TaxID=394098 RepID=UPI0015CF1D69|nr:hypothetical protein [Bhargavaea cecembensis]